MMVFSIQVRGDDSVSEYDREQGEHEADRTSPTQTPQRAHRIGFEGEQRQAEADRPRYWDKRRQGWGIVREGS